MNTSERWQAQLRHRATRPSNERSRTYPLQIRLKPAEVVSLLDDLRDATDLLKRSRKVIDALWKEEESDHLEGGEIIATLAAIDVLVSVDSSPSTATPQ